MENLFNYINMYNTFYTPLKYHTNLSNKFSLFIVETLEILKNKFSHFYSCPIHMGVSKYILHFTNKLIYMYNNNLLMVFKLKFKFDKY